MPQKKRGSRRKSGKKRAPTLGAAGVASLLIAGVAPAGASGASADIPQGNLAPPITLGEEEIRDNSLSTFYVDDNEGAKTLRGLDKVARCYRCTTRVTCRCRYRGCRCSWRMV